MKENMSSVRKVVLSDSKGSVVVSREISDVAMQDPITYSPYGLGENGSSWGYNGAFRSQFQELYQLGNGNRAYLLEYGIMNRSDRTSPEQAGINPYRYCTGNPINFSDPTGNSGSVRWRAGLGIFFGIAAIGLAIPTAGTALGLFAGEVSLTSGILGATGFALGATAVGMSSSAIHLENQAHTDEAHQQALRRSSIGLVLGITGATFSTASLVKTVVARSRRIGTRADMVLSIEKGKTRKKNAARKQSLIPLARNSNVSGSASSFDNPVTFSFDIRSRSSVLLGDRPRAESPIEPRNIISNVDEEQVLTDFDDMLDNILDDTPDLEEVNAIDIPVGPELPTVNMEYQQYLSQLSDESLLEHYHAASQNEDANGYVAFLTSLNVNDFARLLTLM